MFTILKLVLEWFGPYFGLPYTNPLLEFWCFLLAPALIDAVGAYCLFSFLKWYSRRDKTIKAIETYQSSHYYFVMKSYDQYYAAATKDAKARWQIVEDYTLSYETAVNKYKSFTGKDHATKLMLEDALLSATIDKYNAENEWATNAVAIATDEVHMEKALLDSAKLVAKAARDRKAPFVELLWCELEVDYIREELKQSKEMLAYATRYKAFCDSKIAQMTMPFIK